MARINRAIELLQQSQPIYYTAVTELSYEAGLDSADTWADYLIAEGEHHPFDMAGLRAFMRGLVAAGPTRSGHRTPTVLVTLPTDGSSEQVVRTNAWMAKQALATGVHGLILCHAEQPAGVRAFVEAVRYGSAKLGVGQGLEQGRRGQGGQGPAAAIWGVDEQEYLGLADPWPLNPDGEILLCLKIENRIAVENAEASTMVPGIGAAEWGPGDMGMSFGYTDAHDPPFPPEMKRARDRVFQACKSAGIAFLERMGPDNVIGQIQAGVMIGSCGDEGEEAAEIGRRYTKRAMPW